jgi:Holliday junction resolvase RusA-like endonuclease
VKFTILGVPATKKNSPRMFRNRRTGTSFPMPSKASADWTESAVAQLAATWGRSSHVTAIDSRRGIVTMGYGPIQCGVSVKALVYRARAVGDLDNYLTCVGDALQKAGVIVNDKQIESWDHSRKLIDRARPRVEVEVSPYPSSK